MYVQSDPPPEVLQGGGVRGVAGGGEGSVGLSRGPGGACAHLTAPKSQTSTEPLRGHPRGLPGGGGGSSGKLQSV